MRAKSQSFVKKRRKINLANKPASDITRNIFAMNELLDNLDFQCNTANEEKKSAKDEMKNRKKEVEDAAKGMEILD